MYFPSMLPEAAQSAFEQSDVAALTFVLAQCGSSNKELSDKINGMIASLWSGK